MIRKTCGEEELRPQMIKIDGIGAADQAANKDLPRDAISSSDSKRNSIPSSNKNLVRILPPLEDGDTEGLKYDKARELKDKQNAQERR